MCSSSGKTISDLATQHAIVPSRKSLHGRLCSMVTCHYSRALDVGFCAGFAVDARQRRRFSRAHVQHFRLTLFWTATATDGFLVSRIARQKSRPPCPRPSARESPSRAAHGNPRASVAGSRRTLSKKKNKPSFIYYTSTPDAFLKVTRSTTTHARLW